MYTYIMYVLHSLLISWSHLFLLLYWKLGREILPLLVLMSVAGAVSAGEVASEALFTYSIPQIIYILMSQSFITEFPRYWLLDPTWKPRDF